MVSDRVSQPAGPWQDRAGCRGTDTEVFFPEHGNGNADLAKRMCRNCVVRADCLAHALTHDERFGVWGGKTERERRAIKRRVR